MTPPLPNYILLTDLQILTSSVKCSFAHSMLNLKQLIFIAFLKHYKALSHTHSHLISTTIFLPNKGHKEVKSYRREIFPKLLNSQVPNFYPTPVSSGSNAILLLFIFCYLKIFFSFLNFL